MPVNSGRSAPNTASRTRDCTPSAPITSGALRRARRSRIAFRRHRLSCLDAGALAVEMDRVGLLAPDRVEQRRVQVAAVEHHVGKAVALDRHRAEIEQLPGLAGAPEPDLLAGDHHAEPLDRLAEAQRIEHARAVRADLHAGAELLQLRRLFVDVDLDAVPRAARAPRSARRCRRRRLRSCCSCASQAPVMPGPDPLRQASVLYQASRLNTLPAIGDRHGRGRGPFARAGRHAIGSAEAMHEAST